MSMHTLDSFLPVYNNTGADVFGVYGNNHDYISRRKNLSSNARHFRTGKATVVSPF